MPTPTPIDRLYGEATAVIELLKSVSELSLQVATGDYFRKALLLAAASYFEDAICTLVMDFIRERTNGSVLVENFVRNRAVSRQYHQWFAWEKGNANQFYGFFGTEFRTAMTTQVKEAPEIQTSIRAFLELGNERNRLVHQNYATFPLEKTLDEIYALYKDAIKFVEALPKALRDCDDGIKAR